MKAERKLLLFWLLGESGNGRLRDGNDLGQGVRKPLKRRLIRLSRWGTVLLRFSGHVSLRFGVRWRERPSVSYTLAQGENHV